MSVKAGSASLAADVSLQPQLPGIPPRSVNEALYRISGIEQQRLRAVSS